MQETIRKTNRERRLITAGQMINPINDFTSKRTRRRNGRNVIWKTPPKSRSPVAESFRGISMTEARDGISSFFTNVVVIMVNREQSKKDWSIIMINYLV